MLDHHRDLWLRRAGVLLWRMRADGLTLADVEAVTLAALEQLKRVLGDDHPEPPAAA